MTNDIIETTLFDNKVLQIEFKNIKKNNALSLIMLDKLYSILSDANKLKRFLLPFPTPIAKLTAKFLQLMPKPLLTEDQLRLLKYDNVSSGKYKTNFQIGVPSKLIFRDEVKKYSFMWRDGGQFSTDKYKTQDLKK